MSRLAFGVEYAGKNYAGWQSQVNQENVTSVQEKVESALSKVANHPVHISCAGRTDSGVHASGQVVHCDVTAKRTERQWLMGANTILPKDIRLIWARVVDDNFDARRSAVSRHYKYVIYNNPIRPSLLGDYVVWHYHPLDVESMQEAANNWIGRHDFTSFRAAGCQSKTPFRTMKSIEIQRVGDMITFDVVADAFLYHMVRNMVGSLVEVGKGKRKLNWAKEILLAKDRRLGGVTAPAHGLYLVKVEYPNDMQIPKSTNALWFFKQG